MPTDVSPSSRCQPVAPIASALVRTNTVSLVSSRYRSATGTVRVSGAGSSLTRERRVHGGERFGAALIPAQQAQCPHLLSILTVQRKRKVATVRGESWGRVQSFMGTGRKPVPKGSVFFMPSNTVRFPHRQEPPVPKPVVVEPGALGLDPVDRRYSGHYGRAGHGV